MLLLLTCALVVCFECFRDEQSFKVERIAHAGGGVNGITYTNSYDALNLNISNGFKYFELDFSFTKDGQLVCLHDWANSFKRSFGFSTDKKVTLLEFKHLVATKSKFEKCTLDGLIVWMEKNPSAFIITDVKEDNVKALRIMAKTIPQSFGRIIPQIYAPENFKKVKNLGYKQIIWTIYRYQGEDKDILKWVENFEKPFAVAMPDYRAFTSLPEELQAKGVLSYAHTVNSASQKDRLLKKYSVSEIYTDFLVK